jgi:hypothetical protein
MMMTSLRILSAALLLGCSSAAPSHPSPDAEESPDPVTPDAATSKDAAAPVVRADGAAPGPDLPAASEPDTAPPASGGAPAMAVETVQIPASGEAVAMKTSLGMGELYLLKAWGSADVGGQKLDAEYAGTADEAGGMDVGLDIGMKQIHAAVHRTPTPAGPGRMKWFGPAREDHVYYMTVTGEGKPLSIKWTKPAGGAGALSVSLIPLSPAPPKLAAPLDMVMVPVAKMLVMSAMAPAAGKLYLLQASGYGKVGGGGTHMGDADYMDWQENGAGANEGEAGADFGIGVDEEMGPKMSGPLYKPRLRWWGPWRMDHTYYMVFTGTGKPIQFLYFDSGYGDNSPTDALTVKIFEAP